MAMLSYNLIEEILDVAKAYAKQEKARMRSLDADGKPKQAAGHGGAPVRAKPRDLTAD